MFSIKILIFRHTTQTLSFTAQFLQGILIEIVKELTLYQVFEQGLNKNTRPIIFSSDSKVGRATPTESAVRKMVFLLIGRDSPSLFFFPCYVYYVTVKILTKKIHADGRIEKTSTTRNVTSFLQQQQRHSFSRLNGPFLDGRPNYPSGGWWPLVDPAQFYQYLLLSLQKKWDPIQKPFLQHCWLKLKTAHHHA